ncbi:MAG: hypothetical protein EPN43_11670 [Jatrophihabitans sp.]|nr:MAG: hypothetical protein EPN43_11670 [Jatrophihabitans sp.]
MRPFVDFVQQEALPWEPGFLPGTSRRILSADDESGASSEIVNLPPGWTQPAPRVLGAAEEVFVLAGSVAIAGQQLGRFGYARFPESYEIAHASSGPGAIVATFYSRDPATPPESDWDRRMFVPAIDCLRCEASPLRTPGFTSNAKRIDLFDDPDTGESTWILANAALRCDELRPEKHPVVEEMILLAGEMHSPFGIMRPGAYFWRPEHEWHGPFGVVAGGVGLYRTQGGPLSTVYADEWTDFVWEPEYAPVLPDRYRPGVAAHARYDDLAAWGAPGHLAG